MWGGAPTFGLTAELLHWFRAEIALWVSAWVPHSQGWRRRTLQTVFALNFFAMLKPNSALDPRLFPASFCTKQAPLRGVGDEGLLANRSGLELGKSHLSRLCPSCSPMRPAGLLQLIGELRAKQSCFAQCCWSLNCSSPFWANFASPAARQSLGKDARECQGFHTPTHPSSSNPGVDESFCGVLDSSYGELAPILILIQPEQQEWVSSSPGPFRAGSKGEETVLASAKQGKAACQWGVLLSPTSPFWPEANSWFCATTLGLEGKTRRGSGTGPFEAWTHHPIALS